jgi:hypothetical protein
VTRCQLGHKYCSSGLRGRRAGRAGVVYVRRWLLIPGRRGPRRRSVSWSQAASNWSSAIERKRSQNAIRSSKESLRMLTEVPKERVAIPIEQSKALLGTSPDVVLYRVGVGCSTQNARSLGSTSHLRPGLRRSHRDRLCRSRLPAAREEDRPGCRCLRSTCPWKMADGVDSFGARSERATWLIEGAVTSLERGLPFLGNLGR